MIIIDATKLVPLIAPTGVVVSAIAGTSEASSITKIVSIVVIIGVSGWLSYLGKKRETEEMKEKIKTVESESKESVGKLDAQITELTKLIAAKDSEISSLTAEKTSLNTELSRYRSYVTSKTLYFDHDLVEMKDGFNSFCDEALEWLKPQEELFTNREKAIKINEFKKSISEKINLERRQDHEQRRNL